MRVRLYAVAVAMAGLGCSARLLAPTAGDEERVAIGELEAKIGELEVRNRELEAQLAAMQTSRVDGEAIAAAPVMSSVKIDRLSGAVDQDRDGAVDAVVVYVRPEDARGRVVQVSGEIHVTVAAIQPGSEARTLGAVTVRPQEVRELYRESWLGIHYVVHVPVSEESERLVLSVEVKDGLSGLSARATREVGGAL